MRKFCKLGIGSLLLTLVLASPSLADTATADAAPAATSSVNRTKLVGWLEISGPLRDEPLPYSFASEDPAHTMKGVLRQIATVGDSADHAGLVLYLDQPMLSFSQVWELGEALAQVRESGKTVLAFSEAYDLPTYLLACEADRVLLQTGGMMELLGLGTEEMYAADLLEKIGIEAHFLQVGKFKGAEETFTRAGPSESWNQNMDALLDDLYGQIVDRIAQRRGMSRQQLEAAFSQSLGLTDEGCMKAGLVDAVVGRDMIEATEAAFGDSFAWDESMGTGTKAIRPDNPFALFRMLFQPPTQTVERPSIAVIHAQGPITSGQSQPEDMFGGTTVGSRSLSEALGRAIDDDQIKAVILRVDSPGGSALASEMIWQSIREVTDYKPVFVCVGDMAASGGYYLACAGSRIYVTPSSIVGSIGVVGGKLTLAGLYEKIGLNVHVRSRGPMGDLFSSVTPFSPEQRELLKRAFDQTYNQFLDRIREGRGDQVGDLDKVAQGRLFSGRQAVINGLADRLGGIDTVLNDLESQLGLAPDSYDLIHLPEPMSFADYLNSMFGGVVQSPVATPEARAVIGAARQTLGPLRWKALGNALRGVMLLEQERMLTLLPTAIVVR